MSARSTLILVVGPSGVGKDSIIAGAAERLRDEPRVIFARRLITRPAEAGGEDHIALSPAEFARRRDAGELMLHWRAHSLDYGLPGELATALETGRSIVANVSRGVVADARQRFAPTVVIAITASPETLAARLAGRGRESAEDIGSRLRRSGMPVDADVTIDNDGPLDAAIERFVAVLRQAIDQPASL
jgi:phosphonate metabolism protein PhnN/1,5-bisphosphokinase (PRPP-forming)